MKLTSWGVGLEVAVTLRRSRPHGELVSEVFDIQLPKDMVAMGAISPL